MSELNNKPVESLSENSLIDEFIKMGINIESAENKINYSNSNSNKKDLAFNYYFGSNPLNQTLQSNANFLNPNFSHMENFFMNNPIKDTGDGVSLGKDLNAVNYFNPKELNNFNFTPEEFFNMHSKNSVEKNKNINNISQFNPNLPQQNNIAYNNYNKNNLPQNNFANAARDDINYPNKNANNNNLNLNPNNFFQCNKVNFDGIFMNNPQIPEQKAFFNQMGNKENNLANNPIGISKDPVSGFFQNQNPMIKNFKQQNYYFNPIINSNGNNKGSNKPNNFIRNENTNPRIPYENALINGFPMINGFNGNKNQNHYFTNGFVNLENTNNFNSLAKNQNIRFNTNYNNFIGGINNNNNNQPLNNFNYDTKGFKNRNNNQNQRNNLYNMGMGIHINMNEGLHGADNLLYNSNNNTNQEAILDNRHNNSRFNRQNFPGNNPNYTNYYNDYNQKKKNNNNNYYKMNNKAETNQSYLITNPNLLNSQVNSLINLNVMHGTRYFIIKSVDEDNVHKSVKYNIWCSTIKGNQKLQKAFRDADGKFPIYLFFSVNGSGRFLGVAQMTSEIEYRANFNYWSQTEKWKGFFFVKWIYIKDIPNRAFRNLINEFNENKPVTTSRDTQEVSPMAGAEMIKIFNEFDHESSILDDFNFYERKQENVLIKHPPETSAPENSDAKADDVSDNPNTNEDLEQENKGINNENVAEDNFNNTNTSNYPYHNNNFQNNLTDLKNVNMNNNLVMQQMNYGNSVKYNNFNLNSINNMNLIYNQNNFYNIHNSNNTANKLVNMPNLNNNNRVQEHERFINEEDENSENNQEANDPELNRPNQQMNLDPRTLYLLNLNNKTPQFMNNPEMLKAFLIGQNNLNKNNILNNYQLNNPENSFFKAITASEFQSKLNNEENEAQDFQDENHSHLGSEKSLDENFQNNFNADNNDIYANQYTK